MKTEIVWHYLPELPNNNREVLVAYKYDKKPVQAYWNGETWKGSFEVIDYMQDINTVKAILISQENIYAWCELPNCPEIKN